MPIVQIDWQSIKEKFGDVTAIYALTHRQASLLLSLSEQLSWEKTFREFGYDFSDKDDLDWDIDDLRNNLVSPVDLVDIIQYIDDVESLLQIIADNMANEPGCCPDGVQYYPTTPIPDFDTVPQPIVDAGYADDVNDLDGYYDYRCMAGHLFLNNVEQKLVQLTPLITGGFLLFNILAGLFTFLTAGIGTAVVVTIAGLAIESSAIIALINSLKDVSAILPSDWAEDLEGCRDDIVCAMLLADGAEAVQDAFLEQVEICLGSVPAAVIANLNLAPMIEALWYGQQNGVDIAQLLADNELDPADFSCAGCDYGEAYINYPLDTSHSGWDGKGFSPPWDGWTWANADDGKTYSGGHPSQSYMYKTAAELASDMAAGIAYTDQRIRRLEFDYRFYSTNGTGFNSGDKIRCVVRSIASPSTDNLVFEKVYGDPESTKNEWYHVVIEEGDFLDADDNNLFGDCIQFQIFNASHHGPYYGFEFDNIEVWVDEVPA